MPMPGCRAAVITLGCAKNQVDSEIILAALVRRGYTIVDNPGEAELIIVNTCGFLQSAVREGVERVLELARLKKEARCKRLVVAGCMVERYRSRLAELLPEVDRFLSTDELLQAGDEGKTSASCFAPARRPTFLYDDATPRLLAGEFVYAYVKIAEGCNRRCSFCIIPNIRGSYRSRPVASICHEVEMLLGQGVREINLIAQDLTAYPGTGKKRGLPALLASIAAAERTDYWLRLLYAYPSGVSKELLAVISNHAQICKYLDLPLQHISGPVLKKMNRPGEKFTRGIVDTITTTLPDLALRTTLLVGFPGETEEDFERLENFVGEGHFTHLGVFAYSDEDESRAARLKLKIPEEVKQERVSRIMSLQQQLVAERAERRVGSREKVLIEGFHPETELLLKGRTAWQAPETDGEILINEVEEGIRTQTLAGSFCEVEITEHRIYDLVGRVVRVL